MNTKEIEAKAADLRKQVGGTIFGFPINEEDPFSKYAVVVYAGGMYHVYPQAKNIGYAALGINTILEPMIKNGYAASYEKDVRLISYEAQMNAADVTMRRLKKDSTTHTVLSKTKK